MNCYLVEVGLSGRFEGHDEILKFLTQINGLFPDVAFINLQIFMNSPDQVVSEYEVHCSAPSTAGNITSCSSDGLGQRAARSSCCVRLSTLSALRKLFLPMVYTM
jgi:hypothetical protein